MKTSTMIRTTFLVLLSAFVIPTNSLAQGEYILGNESAAAFNMGGYLGSDDILGGSASFGYSVNGIYDIGITAGSQTVNDEGKFFGGFGITFWAAKRGRGDSELSLGFFGQIGAASDIKTYSGGVVLPLQIPVGKETLIVTSFGGGMTKVDGMGYRGEYSYGFGLIDFAVAYPTGPKSKMAFSANATLAEEGNNTFGISVSFLFGWQRAMRNDL